MIRSLPSLHAFASACVFCVKRLAGSVLLLSVLNATAQTNAPKAKLPARENLHLYLLMGQSNMAGRGLITPEDETPNPRVLCFTLGNEWTAAIEPITRDKRPSVLGVGPGLAFGKVMASNEPGVIIGLVPCAVGGTPLKRWQQGGDLYSNAVYRAKLAMKDGTLKGVLWHQGESDSGNITNATSYGVRLAGMIESLRADLGAPDLPVVVGQIGEFLYHRGEKKSYAEVVNGALAHLPEKVPHTACALSKGLTHKGDVLHFNTESQHELGKRYATEMLKLQK